MSKPLPFKPTPVIRRYLQEMINHIKTAEDYGEIRNGKIEGYVTIKYWAENEKHFSSSSDNRELFFKYLQDENIAKIDEQRDLDRQEEEIFRMCEEYPYDIDKIQAFPSCFDSYILNVQKVMSLQKRVSEEIPKSELSEKQKDEEKESVLKRKVERWHIENEHLVRDEREEEFKTDDRYIMLDVNGDFYYGANRIKIKFTDHNLAYYRIFLAIFHLSDGCGLALYPDIIRHLRKTYGTNSNVGDVKKETIRNAIHNSILHRAKDLCFPREVNGLPTLEYTRGYGVNLFNPLLPKK
ncbi:MAG: hypothetical protein WC667_13490 [Sulfurimonas sp.]|jgi:hypothetical protein